MAGFDVRTYEHPPGHRLPWHVHEVPAMVLVRRGGYTQSDPRRSFECAAGEMVVVPAAEATREAVGSAGARSLLIFRRREAEGTIEGSSELLCRLGHFRGLFVSRIGRALARELDAPDPCTPLALEGALRELVSAAGGGAETMGRGAPPAWLLRARELIDDTLSGGQTLEEIARQAGVSRSQLARGFRAWLRTSPAAYLRRARLERARQRLRHSPDAVADIALDAGFYDQSHLSNAFRRAYGVTPAAYRRG